MTRSAASGQLVAIDLPPGRALTAAVADLWERRIAFLIIDQRLTARERQLIVDRAQPSLLITEQDEVLFADGASIGHEIGAVVATSGTRGLPKLAELPRDGLRHAVRTGDVVLGSSRRDRWVACLPPSHAGGLLVLLRGMEAEHPLTVHETFDPVRLAEEGPVWASVVPAMVGRLIELRRRLEGLSLLVGGGEIDPDLRSAVTSLGASVVTSYGLTETCGGLAYDGMPFAGVEVRLDHAERVEVRGRTVMAGYRHDPQATAEAFTLDGWLRTGDLGTFRDDGTLEVSGRADDLIRSGSEKIWPDEVERALRSHPQVADVAVGGLPDPGWGQHVVAWVVPEGEAPTVHELREHCRGRLASFKAPREVIVVEAIPRTSSGKVRRSELPRHE
ncbi:MAG: class I adenylate-forming enzyme family protein [Actinomycetota bacterium]